MRAHTPRLVAFAVAIASAQAPAAGFDCSKAMTRVEKAICADPALSKLDGALATTYRAALGKTIDADALRASQRSWLKQRRDACATDACLTEVYRARRAELERIVAGGAVDPDLAGIYTRWFHGKPDSNSAEIKLRPLGGGEVFATGDATWIDKQTGLARTGSFEGTAAVDGGQIRYSDGTADGCRITISVKDDLLSVANDNGQCGGLNVTFDGAYRKTPR